MGAIGSKVDSNTVDPIIDDWANAQTILAKKADIAGVAKTSDLNTYAKKTEINDLATKAYVDTKYATPPNAADVSANLIGNANFANTVQQALATNAALNWGSTIATNLLRDDAFATNLSAKFVTDATVKDSLVDKLKNNAQFRTLVKGDPGPAGTMGNYESINNTMKDYLPMCGSDKTADSDCKFPDKGTVVAPKGILKLGEWIIRADGETLWFERKTGTTTQKVASVSAGGDRLAVYKNVDGLPPYTYLNREGEMGYWDGAKKWQMRANGELLLNNWKVSGDENALFVRHNDRNIGYFGAGDNRFVLFRNTENDKHYLVYNKDGALGNNDLDHGSHFTLSPNGLQFRDKWRINGGGEELGVYQDNAKVARFATGGNDRFQVYKDANGRPPLMFYNKDGVTGNHDGEHGRWALTNEGWLRFRDGWRVYANGNELAMDKDGGKIVRFGSDGDRIQVFKDKNGQPPYFYYNGDNTYSTHR